MENLNAAVCRKSYVPHRNLCFFVLFKLIRSGEKPENARAPVCFSEIRSYRQWRPLSAQMARSGAGKQISNIGMLFLFSSEVTLRDNCYFNYLITGLWEIMPKRTYPFEGDSLPQMKVHVGEKQVNNGVSSDQRMRDVYDRTLSLLRAGAKTLAHKLNTSTEMDSIDVPFPPSPCKFRSTSNLKQMLLTDKLQLKPSDKIVNDIQVDLCGCTRLIDRSMNACYYCDQALCTSCQFMCANCTELFCQNCSLPVYNCKEQIMCINCYR